MLNEITGKKVRILRKALGMTQKTLAAKSRLCIESISNIENGRQNFTSDTLEAIAVSLNVSPHELMPREIILPEPARQEAEEFIRIYLSLEGSQRANLEFAAKQFQTLNRLQAAISD